MTKKSEQKVRHKITLSRKGTKLACSELMWLAEIAMQWRDVTCPKCLAKKK
jgi:hypothetical protein